MTRPPSESPHRGDTEDENVAARGNLNDLPEVPMAADFEDTDRHNLRSILDTSPGGTTEMQSPSSGNDPFDQLATAFAAAMEEKGMGGGGGGGQSPEDKKANRRHWLLVTILGLLIGPGGALFVIYNTADQTADNKKDIEQHLEQPMHPEAEKEVRYIKARIETVGSDVAEVKAQQTTISAGINQLKAEAQTAEKRRLKEELDELKRELRTERRRNRNR